jgi:intracellular septation protein A
MLVDSKALLDISKAGASHNINRFALFFNQNGLLNSLVDDHLSQNHWVANLHVD